MTGRELAALRALRVLRHLEWLGVVEAALRSGTRERAAEALGCSVRTLRRWCREEAQS